MHQALATTVRITLLQAGCAGLLGAGCVGDAPDPTDTAPSASLWWHTTCGDPACGGYRGPFDGVPACTDQAEGLSCDDEGAQCDPISDCNALFVCAAEDPKQQPGGCPISRTEHKRDITYLDADARDAAAHQALSMRLATWRYAWEGDTGRQHLGFLIDDQPDSPAVRSDGQVVDLYGYTSLAIAALQQQAEQIEQLRAELDTLRQGCDLPAQSPGVPTRRPDVPTRTHPPAPGSDTPAQRPDVPTQ